MPYEYELSFPQGLTLTGSRLPPSRSVGGEGAADFSPGGDRPAEINDRRSVSKRGGRRERDLQSLQQSAGCTAMMETEYMSLKYSLTPNHHIYLNRQLDSRRTNISEQ